MDKFKWAYIGSGNIAKSTAHNIIKGNHEISAVYSRNYEKAKSFAEKYNAHVFTDFESLLKSDIYDCIYIATPHNSHIKYAIKSLNAGKAVLCEKPVGVNSLEVSKMIDAAKENEVYLCEAMWTWFSDMARGVKRWIDDGKIGQIKHVHISYSFPGLMMSKNSRVLTPETAGGALLDIGIYPVTYCYNLFGFPKDIKCEGTIQNGIDIGEKVVLSYDEFDCVLEMSLSTLKESCKITGEKGEIDIPVFHMARYAKLKGKQGKEVLKGKTDYLTEFTLVSEEIKAGKKESEYIPFDSTLNCMKILDECRKQMNLVYPFEKDEEN